MSFGLIKIGSFLKRSKIPIDIKDNQEYKRVTIRIKHNGVSLRDTQIGKRIGTKKQFVLKEGQFILSKIDARYGAFGIAGNDVNDAIITGNFWAYDVDNKLVNIEWFNQYTSSPQFYELCERASSGITHRKYLDEVFFLNHQIYLPSVDEQLLLIDKIKSQKEKFKLLTYEQNYQTDTIKKLRQQILQDAIQGKLVPQDPKDEAASVLLEKIKTEKEELVKEDKLKKQKPLPPIKDEEFPFEIPKSWVWCRLGNICKSILDGTHFSPTNSQTGKFKYITAKNIKEFGIDLTNVTYITKEAHENIYSKCNPEKGDVLFIKDGATTGVVTINNLSEQFSLLSSVALLKIPKFIDNKYFMYAMRSPYYYNSTRNDMYGVAITRVTLIKIQNSMLPIPPIGEQKRIVKKVEELLKICDELEQEITQSKNFSQQLLQSALKEALAPK